ncbi:hypothetical protein [Aliagarivorans taiwanensis]|uniref:hypothetical protein n=1 Tax=Aliagarivorans taiwanensis TaxID=561966 RepID=UPI00047A13AC|nr:hypothetical protein [Aliagarivorans taiwanensis]
MDAVQEIIYLVISFGISLGNALVAIIAGWLGCEPTVVAIFLRIVECGKYWVLFAIEHPIEGFSYFFALMFTIGLVKLFLKKILL